MVYMRITCGNCGNQWRVCESDDFTGDRSKRICTRCGEEIDTQVYEKQLTPAFNYFRDLEKELMKQHTGYHTPLYSVDFISDSLPDKDYLAALLDATEALQDISKAIHYNNRMKRRKKRS